MFDELKYIKDILIWWKIWVLVLILKKIEYIKFFKIIDW